MHAKESLMCVQECESGDHLMHHDVDQHFIRDVKHLHHRATIGITFSLLGVGTPRA